MIAALIGLAIILPFMCSGPTSREYERTRRHTDY